MKIAIIGYSGSGKSTLAKISGMKLGIPVLHLDTVQFVPHWQERPFSDAIIMVEEFMKKPSWIIDGSYSKFLQARRLAEADKIFFLNFSRIKCFYYAFMRYMKYRGRTREDMADGCNEKFDKEFIHWLLFEGRSKARRKQFAEIVAEYKKKTLIFKSRNEINKFLDNLKEGGSYEL